MKKICFPVFLTLCIANIVCAQISTQPATRRNCSFVRRPIIEAASGLVLGKAIKSRPPHLSRKAKKLVLNKIMTVKIEIDESGKVISARTDTEDSILRNPLEKAAFQTKFTPSSAENSPIKITGQIIYEVRNGKTLISYSFDPVQYTPKPFSYDAFKRVRIFDSEILSVITNFGLGKSDGLVNFVKDGQANIQICLDTKTQEIVDKIKQTGFELLEETQSNGLVGRIAVGNLEKLTDIEEIRFVVPEIQ